MSRLYIIHMPRDGNVLSDTVDHQSPSKSFQGIQKGATRYLAVHATKDIGGMITWTRLGLEPANISMRRNSIKLATKESGG